VKETERAEGPVSVQEIAKWKAAFKSYGAIARINHVRLTEPAS